MDLQKGIKRGPFNDSQADRLSNVLSELDADQLQWLSGYFAGVAQSASSTTAVPVAAAATADSQSKPQSLTILFGSHTGHSEALAADLGAKAKQLGIETKVSDMTTFKTRDLKKVENLAIIVSTHGLGEPPVQAEDLHKFLHGKKAPKLSHINYSVLALGDSSYADFCQTGKDFDLVLEKLGAKKVLERQDCDVDYEENAEAWQEKFLTSLSPAQGGTSTAGTDQASTSTSTATKYSKKNLFEATILEKINLNGKGSSKETIHIELDLEDSGITYEPGDALGVYGSNSPKLIQGVLEATSLAEDQLVSTHNGEKTLVEALTYDYELTPLSRPSLVKYSELTDNPKLKEILTDNEKLAEYLKGRDILDLINETPHKLSAEELISVLRKNTARMYSIASSQDAVENEVHLLVSVVRYNALGRDKEGHCSSTLADRLEVDDKVKVFVDKNTRFKLPTDSEAPIIMVGPGTGVAPFRAFAQHLEVAEKRNPSWLFFGDRNFTTDFLYQTEWQQYLSEGVLTKVDVAFSRDQENKLYVQDRMIENGKELYQWLEKGAHFYVCGDASRMAKDVNEALKTIIQQQGGLSLEKTEEYIKNLQLSNRYQTDIY